MPGTPFFMFVFYNPFDFLARPFRFLSVIRNIFTQSRNAKLIVEALKKEVPYIARALFVSINSKISVERDKNTIIFLLLFSI